jgi:predicted CXXCH cytochrome family protein
MSARARCVGLALAMALAMTATVAGAAVPAPAGAGFGPSGRCGVCHPAERVQFEHSRHAVETVSCVSCHGGNDRAIDQAGAHSGRFRGRPARASIPALCASCHSDETRMRAYNLPVDQFALYQTSGHGQALAKGNLRVAVCSDCHGAHDVLPPDDPASRVFPTNIPKTCGGCHGDTSATAPKPGGEYREYLSSVHAHELLDKGNRRAPTCVSCHGAHGAAPPQVGDVDKVCGNCHTAERRYFTAGPHLAGMTKAGLPECASCHKAHAIAAAQPRRLGTACAECHGPRSAQEQLGKRLYASYSAALAGIGRAAESVEKAERIPLPTEDYRARLENARTYLREALPAAHAADAAVVEGFTSRALSVSDEIEREIHKKLVERNWRYVGLALFWFYLILTIVILRRQQKGAS